MKQSPSYFVLFLLFTSFTYTQTMELNPKIAQKIALIQSVAYCNNSTDIHTWKCSRCKQHPDISDFLPLSVHFDIKWNVLGFIGYWPSLNAKTIVFRGTDSNSIMNWIEDLNYWQQAVHWECKNTTAKVHMGFMQLYNESSMATMMKQSFEQLIKDHPTGPTYFIGHSMGASIAQLAALDFIFSRKLRREDVHVYTFGSPRVGNRAFAECFEQNVYESWRFTHGRDIVPSVPPKEFGFQHASREVWLLDDEAEGEIIFILCDDETKEDPTCHESVCRLGLCISIADHLMYIGVPMEKQ